MFPGGGRITCMIYDMFPGLDTNYTDPAQKDVITTGWDIDDLVDRDISDLSDVWTSIMLRTSCQRFPRIGQSGTPPLSEQLGMLRFDRCCNPHRFFYDVCVPPKLPKRLKI